MTKPAETAVETPRAAAPKWIVLLADFGGHRGGKVVAADAAFLAALKEQSVAFRPATPTDLGLQNIAGTVD